MVEAGAHTVQVFFPLACALCSWCSRLMDIAMRLRRHACVITRCPSIAPATRE